LRESGEREREREREREKERERDVAGESISHHVQGIIAFTLHLWLLASGTQKE
jgi:hypothetical protein